MWIDRGALSLALALCTLACGAPQHRAPPPLQPLPETRALEVIREGFERAGVQFELHHQIQLTGGRTMEIDFATAGHPHGVEFLQEQDRADFGSVLPHRQHPDSLLTCVGVGPDASFDVLLVDDHEFMFQPDAAQTGTDQPTLVEVEDRLRRAVVDYLTYLQHHGQL